MTLCCPARPSNHFILYSTSTPDKMGYRLIPLKRRCEIDACKHADAEGELLRRREIEWPRIWLTLVQARRDRCATVGTSVRRFARALQAYG
jgi:hypothetical protein